MARKDGSTLRSPQKAVQKAAEASWAAVGIDTSMTACSVVGMGYDAMTKKMVGPTYADIRWTSDDEYFKRLGEAAKGHELVHEVLKTFWVMDTDKVFIAIEEPFPLGMIARSVGGKKAWQGSYVKQQCEVAGAFKGALVRYGYRNIYEINNAQWKAAVRRDGVTIRKMDEGGKWDIKEWAIKAFGLPDLPDLVRSKGGAKVPRPTEGYGAKAKAVQPNDIYDAAAICAWMMDEYQTNINRGEPNE